MSGYIPRERGTVEGAGDEALDHLTGREVTDATGLTRDAVQKQTLKGRTNFPAVVAAQIDAALVAKGQPRMLMPAMERVFKEALERLGGEPEIERRLPECSDLIKELSEVVAAREEALSDGIITDTELEQYEKEMADVEDLARRKREWVQKVRKGSPFKVAAQ